MRIIHYCVKWLKCSFLYRVFRSSSTPVDMLIVATGQLSCYDIV